MKELDTGDQIGDVETALENLKAWDINNRALLRPYLYAGSMAQEANAGKPVYRRELPIRIFDNDTGPVRVSTTAADGASATAQKLFTAVDNFESNGITWDRRRNNHVITKLSSAVRTATTTTDITTFNAKALIIILDISVVPTTETLTLAAGMVDSVAADVIEMIVTTADADAGKHVIIIDPSGGADAFTDASSEIQQEFRTDLPLPRTVRATVTHSASGNWTYSVEAHLLG